MAILTCPNCLTKLNAPDTLPAGRRVTCAKCQQVFASVVTAPAPTTQSADAIPDAVFVDDDEPPRARRKDEDDDRPRARRRVRDDDDEDDRPRARRRERDDDEDDDRPRARRRQRDDEEPRRPTKRKRISPVLLAGGVVGLLIMLVGIIVLVAYFAKGGAPGGTDLLVHVPNDAFMVAGFDVAALSKNEAFKRSIERTPPFELAEVDRAGIRADDIAQMVVAQSPSGRSCVIRFKSAPAPDKYLNATISGKTYASFKSLSGQYQYGYFVGTHVLVLAEREATIQTLVDTKGNAKLNRELQTRIARTRGPLWRASGGLLTDRSKTNPQDQGVSFRVGSTQSAASWLVPEGELATVQFEIEFSDEVQATQAGALLRGAFQLRQLENDFGRALGRPNNFGAEVMDIRKGYAEATVDVSGRRVTAKMKLPPDEAIRAIGAVRN